jgi:DnaJ domain
VNFDGEGRANRRRFHGALGDGSAPCARAGCGEAGEFRAPAGPATADGPPQWQYLCLDHVREFNAGYNYFDGMDTEQIYAEQHPAAGWRQRTVWEGQGESPPPRWSDFADPLEAITARYKPFSAPPITPRGAVLNKGEAAALKTLGLEADADRRAIRRAYSEKLRLYHPDRNGGDRRHEAALGKVVAAYQTLKESTAFG